MLRRDLTATLILSLSCLLLPASTGATAPDAILEAPTAPGPPAVAAEHEQLRQILELHRVETERPRPGLSRYLTDAAAAFRDWLAEALLFILPQFAEQVNARIEWILKILLAILTLLLAATLGRFAVSWWQSRAAAQDPRVSPLPTPSAAPDEPHWESELERRLQDGETAAAVEALWWWLAGRLVGSRAAASWTSRELIHVAGRGDLMPAVRRLDRMLYGSGEPEAPDVRRLWGDLREATG